MSATWQTRSTALMGTTITVAGGAAALPAPAVSTILDRATARLQELALVWTRFDERSPLQRLNADPGHDVVVRRDLGLAVAAALDARRRSGGLVDPTLAHAIRAAGYDRTVALLDRLPPEAIAAHAARALHRAARPARRPARVRVAADRCRIHRAPGVALDLGGVAKGLAADVLAPALAALDRWSVDVGGDIRTGGTRRDVAQPIHVTHPVERTTVAAFEIHTGAVATSAITARAWRAADGTPAHHLLDPSTGRPAWTGLLQATAIAGTAAAAERLAKEALLRGAAAGRELLGAGAGGVLVHADGRAETIAGRS